MPGVGHAAVVPSPHNNAPEPFKNPVGLAKLAVEPPRMPEHVDPVSLLHNAPPYPSNVGPVGAVDILEVPELLLPPDPLPEPPPGDPDEELPAIPLPAPTGAAEPPPLEPTGADDPPPLPADEPGDVAVTVIHPFCPVVPTSTGAGSALAGAASSPVASSNPTAAMALLMPARICDVVRFQLWTVLVITGHKGSWCRIRPWSRATRRRQIRWGS